MSDVIRLASHAYHYLVVFNRHTEIPLYLGRTRRTASADNGSCCTPASAAAPTPAAPRCCPRRASGRSAAEARRLGFRREVYGARTLKAGHPVAVSIEFLAVARISLKQRCRAIGYCVGAITIWGCRRGWCDRHRSDQCEPNGGHRD